MKLNLGLVKILKFMLPREIFDNMGEIQNVYYMFHASLLSLNKQKENFSVASSHWIGLCYFDVSKSICWWTFLLSMEGTQIPYPNNRISNVKAKKNLHFTKLPTQVCSAHLIMNENMIIITQGGPGNWKYINVIRES